MSSVVVWGRRVPFPHGSILGFFPGSSLSPQPIHAPRTIFPTGSRVPVTRLWSMSVPPTSIRLLLLLLHLDGDTKVDRRRNPDLCCHVSRSFVGQSSSPDKLRRWRRRVARFSIGILVRLIQSWQVRAVGMEGADEFLAPLLECRQRSQRMDFFAEVLGLARSRTFRVSSLHLRDIVSRDERSRLCMHVSRQKFAPRKSWVRPIRTESAASSRSSRSRSRSWFRRMRTGCAIMGLGTS